MTELTLEESIKQVMRTLPPVIRDYVAKGKYTPVAKAMMAKYGLRIDQGGVLEREIMLLLMGIENPGEFAAALAEEARLDQKTVSSIMQDLNEQIFIPLREEMKSTPHVEIKPQQASATPPSAEVRLPQVSVVQQPRGQNLALRDALATVTNKTPQPPIVPSVIVPPAPSRLPIVPASRQAPAIPNAEPRMPTPPVPLPPKPVVANESQAEAKPAVPAAPAKPYTIDPYREPLDGK